MLEEGVEVEYFINYANMGRGPSAYRVKHYQIDAMLAIYEAWSVLKVILCMEVKGKEVQLIRQLQSISSLLLMAKEERADFVLKEAEKKIREMKPAADYGRKRSLQQSQALKNANEEKFQSAMSDRALWEPAIMELLKKHPEYSNNRIASIVREKCQSEKSIQTISRFTALLRKYYL